MHHQHSQDGNGQYETKPQQAKRPDPLTSQFTIQQQDASSVDTELEVSINNAHLLTNLAKAVQEKEKNDLKIQTDQFNNGKVQLNEDLWLFVYEEQAE